MIMKALRIGAPLGVLALSTLSHAQLQTTRSDTNEATSNFVADGTISANEYGAGNSYSYSGGGTGFGGTLGNGGLFMDYGAGNLNIGFNPGGSLNDNVVILIDSRSGGFTDAMMNDTGDPGRNLSTNLTRDVDDQFFSSFLPDYSVVIGSFGIVVFELTSGSLNFLQFDGTFTGNNQSLAREIAISRGSLSLGAPNAGFDFIVGYGSDSNYMSNEGVPGQGFASGGNLGWDNGGNAVMWNAYDHFDAVPEPATWDPLGHVARSCQKA